MNNTNYQYQYSQFTNGKQNNSSDEEPYANNDKLISSEIVKEEKQHPVPLKGYKQYQPQQQNSYNGNQKYQPKQNQQKQHNGQKQFGHDQNKYSKGFQNKTFEKEQSGNRPIYTTNERYQQNEKFPYQYNNIQVEKQQPVCNNDRWNNEHRYFQYQNNLLDKSIYSKNFEEIMKKQLQEDFVNVSERKGPVYQFQTEFLRAQDYSNFQELRKYFAPLKYLNQGHFPYENDIFILIRPKAGHYNIHKAIKYGIWTSFTKRNDELSKYYSDKARSVYLFFLPLTNPNRDPKLIGIAQMISDYDYLRTYKFWDKDDTYIGSFQILWHYIKDVFVKQIGPLTYYQNSKQRQCDLDELREGALLSYPDALKIFEIFAGAPDFPSVLKFFNNLDIQEDKQRYFKQTGRYEDTNVEHPTPNKQYFY